MFLSLLIGEVGVGCTNIWSKLCQSLEMVFITTAIVAGLYFWSDRRKSKLGKVFLPKMGWYNIRDGKNGTVGSRMITMDITSGMISMDIIPSQQLPAKPKRPRNFQQLNRLNLHLGGGATHCSQLWHPHRQSIMTPVRWKGLLVIFKTMRAWAWDEMTGSWVIYLLRHPVPSPKVLGIWRPFKVYLKHQCRVLTLPKVSMVWCQIKFHV